MNFTDWSTLLVHCDENKDAKRTTMLIWYHFEHVETKGDPLGTFGTVKDLEAILDYFIPLWIIFDHARPFWSILDHFEPFLTILEHL